MIDRHRGEQTRRGAVELDAPGGVGDIDAVLATNGMLAGSDPVDLDWAAMRAATQGYLATLDAATRQIIALRFEDELSQDEVSARTGCTRRRVRTVEAEVQAGLRKYLKQRGMYES